VLAFDIIKHLKDEDKASKLEHARKWQIIDLDNLKVELQDLTPLKIKMYYLSERYPSLFVHILEHFGMTDKIAEYMDKCKVYG